ncbi:putative MFS family arabinose efflux permease [Tamaricihabitans halophyticus]|uniref:Putative MFS family arabinose efflux permease n=1 Tax=Tamaricihabitans halophyticus TaxID=1262583 RepID=A0A4R2R427_9PSEU|nr:MFS transporter [Tamaricihabitans halophyticus]TCP56489.1 putative MFS family arabinose efflux permease [Tamaricihabitans halophyticus]
MQRSTRSPLATGEWRSLWIAEALSVAGDQLARVAISVLVYERTSSAALTAVTYALTFLPDIVAGPLLSGLADRFPRREVMVFCTTLQTGIVAIMAIPGISLWILGTCVAGIAALQAPFKAAQNAHVRVLLGNQHLTVGQARLTTLREMGQLAGLGGATGVVGFVGVTPALIIDAGTFALATVLLSVGLRRRPAARATHAPLLKRSLPPSRRRKALATLSILLACTILPHGLIVPFVAEIGAPTWSVGLILAADSVGFLLGAAFVGRKARPRAVEDGWIGPLAGLCMGALVLFALNPSAVFAGILLATSSFGASYHILARSAYIEMLPDELTGRATGLVRTGLRTGQGLGVAFGGIFAEWLNSTALAISVAAAVGLLGCLVAWLIVKRNPADAVDSVANDAVRTIESTSTSTPGHALTTPPSGAPASVEPESNKPASNGKEPVQTATKENGTTR